ncbi:solute carrier family 23 protein [Neoroseomonas soli]|uniref:Xanthine/uracil permease n=1 Tax=Neoroseomonas soli TaxID=1081025 RepID=A0A9X9X1R6_9PROT|nr:solute carrier family 23 protein [Neoroseomonas soli]MBR0673345.1 hypothetical protein [Neoroseomonas soli]
MSAAAGTRPLAERLAASFSREGDRNPAHVPDVVLGLEDHASLPRTIGLALQQVAIQSIYFVLPGVVAAAFGADPLAATNFLCLSLVGLAVYAVLQALTRGPVGSGYAIPAIPSAVLLAPMLLAAQMGAGMAEAAALTILAGVAMMGFAPLVRRLSTLMPTEVTGVVVFLIGASVLPTVMSLLRFDAAAPAAALPQLIVALGCFFVMVVLGVLRSVVAPYAVLIGGVAGTAAALGMGMAPPGAETLLAAAPWFAVPQPPSPPDFGFGATVTAPFLLCLIAALASLIGTVVAFQRATDGAWTRPDPGPLRRGILAHGLAIALTGMVGGMGPAASSACVGVSIATRTFARSIAMAGAGILFLLAFCPKAAALFVLVPAPVQAAMLLYVAGFMMAQGCEMVVVRTLDTRRTVVAGLGLSTGLAVLAAPGFFAAAVPALAAPLAMGGLAAFLANLVTLPLVKRTQAFTVPFGAGAPDLLEDRCFAIGGAWSLRGETVRKLHHALIEIGDLLAGRGLREMTVTATQQEETVVLAVAFAGAPLPPPARRPRLEDAEAGGDALEAMSLWLALREASRHATRSTPQGQELRIEFLD